ncbi:TPA: hypothetical protein I7665_11370 [Vibrio vulnificus]|nr:hypothetical protein [Vibrio vulnificus]
MNLIVSCTSCSIVYSLTLLLSYSLTLLLSYSLILLFSYSLILLFSFTRFSASIARGCARWINSISTHYQLPPQSQVDVLEGE